MKSLFVILILMGYAAIAQEKSLEVYFDSNSATLTNNTKEALLKHTSIENFNEVIIVKAYCDEKGSADFNKELAQKRLDSVVQFLISKNIPLATTIQKNAIGEDFKKSNVDARNRKVVLYYSSIKKIENELERKIKMAKVGDKIKLDHINFYNGSDRLLPDAIYPLKELLEIMKQHPKIKIDIQGHICCQDSDYEDISTARAKAVHAFLLYYGIEKERIKYIGFGSKHPIYPLPENNETERIANRRVEIKIIQN